MKILMVTSGMDIGGAETHILELCRALKKRGFSVSVASAGGVYVRDLEKYGIPHITLPLNRRTPPALLACARGLARYIRREKPDIVHAHARIPAFLCGKLRGLCGFRFVTTDHIDFRLTPLLKRLTDWGEFTFAVSEDLRKYLLQNFQLDPKRIALTVNGIDTERFSPRTADPQLRERLAEGDRAVVLHISRLEKHLCICAQALMGAAAHLKGRITLVLVGDGAHAQTVKEEADVLNRRLGYRAILFAGAVTDVEKYIAAADVVVSPSRAAMEAMACAKPTVVCGSQGYGGIFDESIAKEAVGSNFCFRGGALPTAELLARDIEKILAMSEKERAVLGAFGRAFICRHYSVDVMAQTHEEGYRKLLCGRADDAYDILICGYYGYGNMGDETLLSVISRELRRETPSLRLCALSARPEHTRLKHGVDAVARFDPEKVSRAMNRSGILLFGGGNLLQDKTSTHSLLYYTHILQMAKKRGMKILIFANGIGPLLRKENERRVARALSLADAISLRECDSFALVQRLCPDKPLRLTFDPAILTEPTVCTCPEGDYFAVVPKRHDPDCTDSLVGFIRSFAQKHGLKPILVSLYEKQDLEYVRMLSALTGAKIYRPRSAGECVALFSSAQLVLSSRLHGLVYATAAKCPMMGYSDDGKLFSYLEYIGFGANDSVPCGLRISASVVQALGLAEKILAQSGECRRELSRRLPAYRALALADIAEAVRLAKGKK